MQMPKCVVIIMMGTTLRLHAGPYDSFIVIMVKTSASASTDDGTDNDNLDRPDNHDRSNHDVVMNHQNKDNHRNGGRAPIQG